MKVSVLILTQNNQDFIENCLKSVKDWAEEIVVIDAGSTDKTLAICQLYHCQIYHHPWPGFAQQRTLAAQKAKNDWIFYLDVDERLTTKLKQEINNLVPDKAAYQLKRENIILGKWLKQGGWYPDKQTRLINKQYFKGWQGRIHEYPLLEGEQGQLQAAIIHLTHRGINWSLDKTMIYTDHVAQLLYEAPHPRCRWWHLTLAFFREFWQRGIVKRGLFEGMEGFITVIYQSFDAFIAYAKLWELQKKRTMGKVYQQIDKELLEKGEY
ncbi:hypothetical protein A2160_02995 [Candidatus Beckwithbacteria bacterium RBG_13_42_9]|uniref:Glycosyltransferase 2-like domain-containing protein n=1 Tax=Candidatus Beckwithbacteria bacterium RBG_13_42_9 TaxID=1797457 RepID=A0A1F5E7R1_9BACT|nr:MAG: hypothetical protein A2160_02995 [Candidatus Beckwithbacteria bacterium RBG_13_42_9]